MSGPSGVGKGTVVAALAAERDDVEVAVSATTRPPRPGERDGVHYHFMDRPAFDDLVEAGGFLEWAEYNGQRYGTPWRSVRAPLDAGRIVVLEIDVQGARQVRRRFPDAVLVFLHPPDDDELAQRVRSRGTDDDADIERRLEIARAEVAQAHTFDHEITNAEVDQAVEAIGRIVDRHCAQWNARS